MSLTSKSLSLWRLTILCRPCIETRMRCTGSYMCKLLAWCLFSHLVCVFRLAIAIHVDVQVQLVLARRRHSRLASPLALSHALECELCQFFYTAADALRQVFIGYAFVCLKLLAIKSIPLYFLYCVLFRMVNANFLHRMVCFYFELTFCSACSLACMSRQEVAALDAVATTRNS